MALYSGIHVAMQMLLTYTGYIDRGQRIESRFSGRPIRMIGMFALYSVLLFACCVWKQKLMVVVCRKSRVIGS
jgi:hypothetical protein